MKKRFAYILVILLIISLISSEHIFAVKNRNKITNDDMIYFIMTDRFNDGDMSNDADADKNNPSSYHGGDFQGIIDKLDYIKSLGFTAIWITPVVKNQPGGYHGYWAVDFYETDEHLGSRDKLKELVLKAHSKGIKVIFDLVVNHTGDMHPWVNNPKYADWFHDRINISNYNDQSEVENGWLAGLPDLNQENPEVKKYLIDMAKWWIKETGIDGYRLDTMKHVPKDFWNEFSREIKKDYPDFYLIGEVYDGNADYVSDYQYTGVDGLMDFPVYFALTDVFKNGSPEMRLEDAINKSDIYKNRHMLGTFIDNHDVPRFSNDISAYKDEKLKQALTFMMTYTGIPVMYYGTEIGMDGGADPDNRSDMDWEAKSPITDYVKKLASIRKSKEALRSGDIKVLETDSDVLCYLRQSRNEIVIAAFNTLDDKKEIQISVPGVDKDIDARLHSLLDDKYIDKENGVFNISMTAHEAQIYEYQKSNNEYIRILLPALAVLLGIALFCVIKRCKRV